RLSNKHQQLTSREPARTRANPIPSHPTSKLSLVSLAPCNVRRLARRFATLRMNLARRICEALPCSKNRPHNEASRTGTGQACAQLDAFVSTEYRDPTPSTDSGSS